MQFYPDFEDVHYAIKMWFDYFSDTFYYKLFSAWDIIGHFLNVKYGLKIPNDKVYFSIAVNKLKDINKNIYSNFNDIMD